MAYPDFTLAYGATNVTLNNQNIVSWSRAMVEPDSNDLYKGLPVRINGDSLHRWSLSLIASSVDTGKIKQIYREATRDRFNKELPNSFEVTLTDNAEFSTGSVTHQVLIGTCTPKPISCDRYEIELELVEMVDFAYVPTFRIGSVTFNQSEITSYQSSAVVEEEEPNKWEWSLSLILDSAKMTALGNVYNSQVNTKKTPPYSGWGVSVDDNIGAGPANAKCQIMSYSHTTSFRGFEVEITLKSIGDEDDGEDGIHGLTFSVAGATFVGKEIESANIGVLVTRSIEAVPTGALVIRDNCGPGSYTWSCSFKSTKGNCRAVVEAAKQQRVTQLNRGQGWGVPVSDGVNGGGGMCAIESVSMTHVPDEPGKYTLSVELRELGS